MVRKNKGVTTLPASIRDIAYTNKGVIYALLFKARPRRYEPAGFLLLITALYISSVVEAE